MSNTNTNPSWWTDEHASAWDRVKAALKRDWEQTKSDFTTKGKDLHQNAADTVKQAVGARPVPPIAESNVKLGNMLATWDEDVFRFGAGARHQYGTRYPLWSDSLEEELERDYRGGTYKTSWGEARASIRRAYERSGN